MRNRAISTLLAIASAGLVLASCGSRTTSLTAPLASAPGITTTSVLFATEVDAGVHAQPNSTDETAGMEAVLKLFDNHHGIYGRQLSLAVKNDVGQAGVAEKETQYLGSTVGAFALVGDSPDSVVAPISTAATSSGILQLFPLAAATGPNTVNTVAPAEMLARDVGAVLRYLDLANGTVAVLSPTSISNLRPTLGLARSPELLTIAADGGIQGLGQLTTKVPDLILSFASPSATAQLLAELAQMNEAPTVIVAEDTATRVALEANAPHFHGTVLRFGTWIPTNALTPQWRGYLADVDRLLPPKVPLNLATIDGVYAATMSVELLRSVGINPSRRAILTSVARHAFSPVAPGIGPWSAVDGFTGGVLTGTPHPLYVTGDQRVTETPPSFPAPPTL